MYPRLQRLWLNPQVLQPADCPCIETCSWILRIWRAPDPIQHPIPFVRHVFDTASARSDFSWTSGSRSGASPETSKTSQSGVAGVLPIGTGIQGPEGRKSRGTQTESCSPLQSTSNFNSKGIR